MSVFFEIVPEDFFKILTSKNKFIYTETIFRIDDLMHSSIYISRDDVVESLCIFYEEINFGFKDFEDDEEYTIINTYHALAQSILRELQKKGWIQIIYEEGYIEQVSFPSYANRFVQVMRELSESTTESFTRNVFSTYSNLKTGLTTPGSELQGIEAAWKSTKDLQRSIQNAYYDLSKVYTSVIKELSSNDMLIQHFEVYKQGIIDRVLYPLKTSDSVLRYKNPILDLLEEYEKQETLEKLIYQYLKKDQATYTEEKKDNESIVEKIILNYINSLLDFYNDVTRLLDVIDNKKEEYTAKSLGKIQYQLRSDYLLKSKIDQLIHHLKKKPNSYTSDLCNVMNYESVSKDSFYKKPERRSRFSEKARLSIDFSEISKQADQDQILMLKKLANPKFSGKNVDQFVNRLLTGKDSISSDQIEIVDYDSFILTIMGAIRGYEKNESGYSVEFRNQTVVNGNYLLPLFIFKRG